MIYRVPSFWKFIAVVAASLLLSGIIVGALSIHNQKREAREMAEFRELPSNKAKLKIEQIIADKGPLYAWHYLKEAYSVDGQVLFGKTNAHSIAHFVGEGLYERYGLAQGLAQCDHSFAEGCMHGVVEKMIQEQGTASPTLVGEVCMQQLDANSCAHGVGHGLIDATGRDIAVAVRWCGGMPGAIAPDCVEGALMDDSVEWDEKEMDRSPWTQCENLASAYQMACASAVGNYFSERRDNDGAFLHDPAYVSSQCEKAPQKDLREECFLRLYQSIVRRAEADPARMYALCAEVTPKRVNRCVVTANDFVENQKVF